MNLKERVDNCIAKIQQCYNLDMLMSAEDELANIGLALRETRNGKMMLCRIEKGRPVLEELTKDFVFVGYADDPRAAFLGNTQEYIIEFINLAASDNVIKQEVKSKHQQMGFYGKPLTEVNNEDMLDIMQRMGLYQSEAKDMANERGLLDAVHDWLENSDASI